MKFHEVLNIFFEELLEVIIIVSINMYMMRGELDSAKILKTSIVIAGIITAIGCYKTEYGKTFKTAMIITLVAASVKKIND